MIQAHYHFAEHRQKLACEIEEISSNDYKPPVVKLHIPIEKPKDSKILEASKITSLHN